MGVQRANGPLARSRGRAPGGVWGNAPGLGKDKKKRKEKHQKKMKPRRWSRWRSPSLLPQSTWAARVPCAASSRNQGRRGMLLPTPHTKNTKNAGTPLSSCISAFTIDDDIKSRQGRPAVPGLANDVDARSIASAHRKGENTLCLTLSVFLTY